MLRGRLTATTDEYSKLTSRCRRKERSKCINHAVAATTQKESRSWRELEGPHKRILSIQCSINEIKSKNQRVDLTFYLPGLVSPQQSRWSPKDQKGRTPKQNDKKFEALEDTERFADLERDGISRLTSERSRAITRESVFKDAEGEESREGSGREAKGAESGSLRAGLPVSFGGLMRKTVRLARGRGQQREGPNEQSLQAGSRGLEDTCQEWFSTASNNGARVASDEFGRIEQHIERLSKNKLINLKQIIDRKIRNKSNNKENEAFFEKIQKTNNGRRKSRVSSSKKVNFSTLSKDSIGGLSELTEKPRGGDEEEGPDWNDRTVVTTLSELEINGYIHKYYDSQG
jgi:hypothetical protein